MPSRPSVQFVKTSDWGTAYEASMMLTNPTATTILDWTVECEMDPTRFTWISDVTPKVKKSTGKLVLTPQEWCREIPAGGTREVKFGARGPLPASPKFKQLVPLANPGKDASLQTRGAFGSKMFVPYVDATAYPIPPLATWARASGQKFFTLGFVTSQQGRPAWGGVIPLEAHHLEREIRSLRTMGGDVVVSFGGANGTELAMDIPDPAKLAAAYQAVIDMYKLTFVDFDIEGAAVAHAASVDRRNKAIKILQARNPALEVSLCLPVLPTGLTADGLNLVANAKKNGVRVSTVAAMAMDFGDSAAPDPKGRMAQYVIQSAQSVHAQLATIGLSAQVGIIPMIGVNDVETEVFTVEDARKVATFAAQTPWIRSTAFWSGNRDRDDGQRNANSKSSGIKQREWDFTHAFKIMA